MERITLEQSTPRFMRPRQAIALGGSALALLLSSGCESVIPSSIASISSTAVGPSRPPVPEHCKVLSGLAAVHGKGNNTKATVKQPPDCADAKVSYFAFGNLSTPISGLDDEDTITINCRITKGEHAPAVVVQGRTPETPLLVHVTAAVADNHDLHQANIPGCVITTAPQETTR